MSPRAEPVTPRRSPGRRLTERLSIDDWTKAGLQLLMREGVQAIKISRLCEKLGVTKGSFYWHFQSLADLLEAMAERWCAATEETLGSLSELAELPPRERLQGMTDRLVGEEAWTVEKALRDWARTDERIARAVEASDVRIFQLVEGALLEHGLSADQARVRAGILVLAGVGFAHANRYLPKPTREEIGEILNLLMDKS